MGNYNILNFSDRIYDFAISRLDRYKSDADIVEMMESLFSISENEVQEFITDSEKALMDCKEGCSTCCCLNVSVLTPEAIIIADYLRTTLSEEELSVLKNRMQELLKHIKYLDADERVFVNKKCAFLNDKGGCSIYPVRPFFYAGL